MWNDIPTRDSLSSWVCVRYYRHLLGCPMKILFFFNMPKWTPTSSLE